MKKLSITRFNVIASLIVGVIIIILAMYWHISKLHDSLIESTALRTAELYTASLKQMRSIYTKYVVTKVEKNGIIVSHDFIGKSNTIPLPASLTVILGKSIGDALVGADAHLYSPYPFPWKKEKNKYEDKKFDNNAWDYLSKNPNSVYYKFVKKDKKNLLRYATADIMRENCISCHNAHPDTPKNDWKVGDVRGVLEVNIPLHKIVQQTNENIKKTMIYYIVIGLMITILIGYVIYRLYKQTDELEETVEKRTNDLKTSNDKLNHIFNITPNITFLGDKKRIIKVNNQFLKFVDYSNLDEFLKNYDCISDIFLVRKGYLQPFMDGINWVEYVISHPNFTHKAVIEKNGVENQFIVISKKYIEDDNTRYIVILENVTELQKTANTDQLTSISNRLKIDEELEQNFQSYKRYNSIFSIILLDIDNFKQVNDKYGHLVGDEILKCIAKILTQETRTVDLVGRWGGEEFIVISKKTNLDGASTLAEKIRESIESYKFETASKQSVSLGVAQYRNDETIDELLKRADDALYKAKDAGRNRVVVETF